MKTTKQELPIVMLIISIAKVVFALFICQNEASEGNLAYYKKKAVRLL